MAQVVITGTSTAGPGFYAKGGRRAMGQGLNIFFKPPTGPINVAHILELP